MKSIYKYLVLLLMLCSMSKAQSIDGLFFSIGLGSSKADVNIKERYSGFGEEELNGDLGLGFSTKLGYGFNDDIAVYFFINSSLVPGYSKNIDESSLVNSVLGIGVNYYIDSSNIFYLIGGLGTGQFMELKDTGDDIIYGENDIYRGDGYMVGLGVNLYPNIHLEFVSLGTDIDDVVDDKKLRLDTTSTQLLLNYYWY